MDKAKIFQREITDTPLIYVGGVQSGDNCQQIMDEGFELFQIAHVLIKDPEFVHHVEANPHYHAGCGRSNYCVGRMYTKEMKCHTCVLKDGEPIPARIQKEIDKLEKDAQESCSR
jgi:2,4-dienoyl-CoA reductase-like NADH-dependent reductase (Old Yellow Enzyme family)